MGDWTDKDEFVTDVYDFYGAAWEERFSAQFDWNLADTNWHLLDEWTKSVVGQLKDSVQHLITAVDYLTCTNWAYEPPFAVPYGFKYMGGEVTVEAICEAWAKDSFKGRALTIAFIDRMRQLIWNEPFSIKWAAKPEEGR